MSETLRIHAISHGSLVNGPGVRTVVHVQGCSIRCKGCFNPGALDPEGGIEVPLEVLEKAICSARPDGVTFSGGEPTDQLEPLVALCRRLRSRGFSIVVFSGRTRSAIASMPRGRDLLDTIDVLIDGPFDPTRVTGHALRGSENQTIHLLTPRHRMEEFSAREVELVIDPQGNVRVSGFPDAQLTQALEGALQQGSQGGRR